MDYLDRIIDEHEKCKKVIKHLNIPRLLVEKAAREIITSNAPTYTTAKMLSEHEGIGINLAHAIIRHHEKDFAIDIDLARDSRHITLSRLLDDELHTLNRISIDAALNNPELIPKLKEAFKRRIPNIETGIRQYNFYKRLMSEWGWDLKNLEYWDFTQPINVNLSAIGFHPNRNLIPFIVKEFSFLQNQPLGELWSAEYLSNIFTPNYVYKVLKLLSERDNNVKGSVALIKKLFDNFTENEYSQWNNTYIHRALLALWMMRYKTWFNYQTNVVLPEYNITVAVNHHELIVAATKKKSFWTSDALKPSTHPKDYFAGLIQAMAVEITHRLLAGRKNMTIFPRSPIDSELLPDTWRHIGSDYQLISEGQTMHHCCGGKGYIDSVCNSRSLFYHIDTGESYGLTAEFKPFDLNYINTIHTMNQWIPHLNNVYYCHSNGGVKGSVWVPRQVKGRFNRRPDEQELFDLNLAVTKACDLTEFYTLSGIDRVGVLTNSGDIIVLNVTDPGFKTKYITLAMNGATKYAYVEAGQDIPPCLQETASSLTSTDTGRDFHMSWEGAQVDFSLSGRGGFFDHHFRRDAKQNYLCNRGWGLEPSYTKILHVKKEKANAV